MTKYNERHGGPYDRGAADSYYGRGCVPHYFLGDTHSTPKVTEDQMTKEEIEAYLAGYDDNAEIGNYKQWD